MNSIDLIIQFIVLGLANGMISFTITKSNIFQSFRDFFFFRSGPKQKNGKFYGKIFDLVSCPYCTSHWIAIAMIAIWQPVFTDCGFILVDLFISVFANIFIASVAWGTYFKLTFVPQSE